MILVFRRRRLRKNGTLNGFQYSMGVSRPTSEHHYDPIFVRFSSKLNIPVEALPAAGWEIRSAAITDEIEPQGHFVFIPMSGSFELQVRLTESCRLGLPGSPASHFGVMAMRNLFNMDISAHRSTLLDR